MWSSYASLNMMTNLSQEERELRERKKLTSRAKQYVDEEGLEEDDFSQDHYKDCSDS